MLRILFAGTPEIAVPTLRALLSFDASKARVVGVLTNPDRPAGRKRRVQAGPVRAAADAADVPVLSPERLDAGARQAVRELEPDLMVVVAYGKIFGPKFLDLFSRGAINMHPSLLPRHRGPSPIQAAILSGDRDTGVTVQKIGLEMDAGPILTQKAFPLDGGETAPKLHDTLALVGADLVVETLAAFADREESAVEQDHSSATYCTLIRKSDGYLTLEETAEQIERMVRAYNPWPGVSVRFQGRVVQILESSTVVGRSFPDPPGTLVGVDNGLGILLQTSNGVLAVRRLKPEFRSAMDWSAFLNGHNHVIGSVLERM